MELSLKGRVWQRDMQPATDDQSTCTEVHLRFVECLLPGASLASTAVDRRRPENQEVLQLLRAVALAQGSVRVGHVFDLWDAESRQVAVCATTPKKGGTIDAAVTQVKWDEQPVPRLNKVQLHCLDQDIEPGCHEEAQLYDDFVKPFLLGCVASRKAAAAAAGAAASTRTQALAVLTTDRMLILRGARNTTRNFWVTATDPPGNCAACHAETDFFVNVSELKEIKKIDVRPYQDTLPGSYNFDVFQDYLMPYLDQHRLTHFHAHDIFTFHGVRFRVIALDPPEGGRVGASTVVYSDGPIQPTLLEVLPPELMQDLQRLPPGLQMLLLNNIQERAAQQMATVQSLQQVLAQGKGLTKEQIANDLDPPIKWVSNASMTVGGSAPSVQVCTSCMVCLVDFEEGEVCRRLSCGHVFHQACIDEWFSRSVACPICKREAVPGAEASSAEASRNQSTQAAQAESAASSRRYEQQVATLVSMGIETNAALRAITLTGGDIDAACAMLFD